jgi:hypothetical protein
MKTIVTTVSLLLSLWPALGTQTNSDAIQTDGLGFEIIEVRNIFDFDRSPPIPLPPEPETNSPPPPVRVEYIACVGTMQYEEGVYAFFEGSRSDYQKVLEVSNSIAGFRIADIESESVRLICATNELLLPVGAQMRQAEGGRWLVVAYEPAAPATSRLNPARLSRESFSRSSGFFRSPDRNRSQTGDRGRGTPSANASNGPDLHINNNADPGDTGIMENQEL